MTIKIVTMKEKTAAKKELKKLTAVSHLITLKKTTKTTTKHDTGKAHLEFGKNKHHKTIVKETIHTDIVAATTLEIIKKKRVLLAFLHFSS